MESIEAIDSDLPQSNIIPRSILTSNTDLLFRVQQDQQSGNTTPTLTVSVRPTESVRRPFIQLVNENNLFRDIVKNLWQLYKYHQEYEAFLLGACTEAEFLAIAERYASSFRHMPPNTLIWASVLLFNVLEESLTSSDLSVILNVDPLEIENALSASQVISAVPLEDQETHGEPR